MIGGISRNYASPNSQFQTDVIIDCTLEPLLATQVSFGRLYRDVSQQELDLFKLAARGAAQPRAGPATIVRR